MSTTRPEPVRFRPGIAGWIVLDGTGSEAQCLEQTLERLEALGPAEAQCRASAMNA